MSESNQIDQLKVEVERLKHQLWVRDCDVNAIHEKIANEFGMPLTHSKPWTSFVKERIQYTERKVEELEKERDWAIQIIQKHQPEGSPPPGTWVQLLEWVLSSLKENSNDTKSH